jgi:uncharacterized protein (TIGR03067 family)
MNPSRESARVFRAVMLVMVAVTSAVAWATDEKDEKQEAIAADRALLAGEWRVVGVEANGTTNADLGVARVTVVNGLDGTWSLLSNGKTIAEGTSTIDPTTRPKTIELKGIRGSVENARGKRYRGIYEVHETTRRICFVPADKPLPEAFAGTRDSGQILVTFERVVFE